MSIQLIIEIFLHLDKYLGVFMGRYGVFAYVMIFLAIFCETGLVVTPFLPGDSLIFAAGALAAKGIMGFEALIIFYVAAIGGNMLNYQIGRILSDKVRNRKKMKLIKQENIDKTQKFFDKYGGITIIITRFMPIIRTFSPFVAGVGHMKYKKFWFYNAAGGLLWASAFFFLGLFFGNIPFVKNHFSFIVLAIIVISVIPAIYAFLRPKFRKKAQSR